MPTEGADRGSGTHLVPESNRADVERVLAATAGLRGEPTDAERARTLLAEAGFGTLATTSADPAGYPFGSLVGYAVDDSGRPLLWLSNLAKHSKNLVKDHAASLMAAQPATAETTADPLARARVTVLGAVEPLDGDGRDAAATRYRAAHPSAFYADFADFRLYRMEVVAVRYVGGFGRMSWLDAAEFTAAEPDPLRRDVGTILEHMNTDHPDALVAYCRVFGGLPGTTEARMVHIDRYGFDVLAADTPDGDRMAVRIAFGARVDTLDAVRATMIELLSTARRELSP
jgi:putative heme iron utilization protein